MKTKEGGVMDIQKEREAFENWHIRNMDINSDFEKISEQDSPYMDEHVNNSWLTWQASKAQANKQFENFIDQAIEDSACADERRSLQALLDEFQEQAND